MPAGNPGLPRKLPSLAPSADWMQYAECKGMDRELFFPPNGHNLLNRDAKEACNRCPVQLDCLEYAIENNLDHGIWGGATERSRVRIRRARKTLLRLAQNPMDPPHSAHG